MNDAAQDIVRSIPRTATRHDTIGKLLLTAGKLSLEEAERILQFQKENGLRFGEAALALGLVKHEDIQFALAQQFDYPYLLPGESDLCADLVAAYHPYSQECETFRILRTQLMLRWFQAGERALCVCGAEGGEGVSYQVANLGIVCSQLGERTLIIDANLRKPRQHTLFSIGNNCGGLADMLAGRAGNAIYKVPSLVDLSVIPAGTPPPNPVELLSRSNFALMLHEFSGRYDIIIIDSPAANLYADTQSIASIARGVLLVCRLNSSRISQIEKARQLLLTTHAQIVGAALSNF